MKVPAYLDSTAGLIKCIVLGRYGPENRLVVKITARNSLFRNHSILHYSAHRVVPRDKVFRVFHEYKIKPFTWDMDSMPIHDYEGVAA